MTIIRNTHNTGKAKDFVIVGVGGAGSIAATELSKILGNPDDVIVVDRDLECSANGKCRSSYLYRLSHFR